MTEFPDLRTFLLLESEDGYKGESIHRNDSITGRQDRQGLSIVQVAVHRYDIAKTQWERYGDDGPPPGTRLMMLRAGFGGGAGVIRTVVGPFERDDRYITVVDPKDTSSERRYLLSRRHWWNDCEILEQGKNDV